jgi:activator of HSP90 ATPase
MSVPAPIHQEVDFKASPKRIYEMLADAKQFNAFSGLPAEIHGEAGGVFECFGEQITGRMTELVPSQKIVQTWHVAMWPDGVNSIVRFELKARGEGTKLILDHADFPEENREHLDSGWSRMYWEPMRKYLA